METLDAEALPDQRLFRLNAAQWAAFQAALNAPSLSMPRLEKLLRERSVFELNASLANFTIEKFHSAPAVLPERPY